MIAASSAFDEKRSRSWPPRGWVGVLLIAIFWPLNWLLPGLRTAYLFFPLWLGYILAVDTLVEVRTGTSLWSRSRQDFVLLFFLSAPAWWLFEVMNRRLGNWQYLGGEQFSDFEYYVLSSISFSTVMPAVFGTAELIRSYRWIDRVANGPRVPNTPRAQAIFFCVGLAMLSVMLIWPKYFYPFAWTSLVFILEPINYWLGHPHFTEQLERGDWRKVISLAVGALACGFFWEMWNYYSYPKWIYHTPGAQFLHIFEMPLLGYLGYIPFALELCALKNLISPKRIEPRL
jgi:hypothetical protein